MMTRAKAATAGWLAPGTFKKREAWSKYVVHTSVSAMCKRLW